MQLRYDEDLIEAAVVVCVNSRRLGLPAMQLVRFHREREKLYAILDPDQRNTAFYKLHLDWFREWGLEKLLTDLVNEFPFVRSSLHALAFRRALRRNEEGAELYVNAQHTRNSVVALRVERFARADELTAFLRHEFTHLEDMLDPAFGYSPELSLPDQNPASERLARERYRLLWDITIDGRLDRASRAILTTREQHRAAFDRMLGFWSQARRDELFASLWSDPAPRHAALLAIAADPRAVSASHRPLPGAACPLCGFATFNWANLDHIEPTVFAAILKEFPAWSAEHGSCERCVEIYRVLSSSSPLPA